MAFARKLVTKRERIQAESAARLRQLVLEVELPERLRGELVHEIDRRTAGKRQWVFKQMSAEDNAEVGRWIKRHAQRPLLTFALWHEMPALLGPGPDNEILASRAQLAKLIGTNADTVTRLMQELEGIHAIRRERSGKEVRYFLSPWIITTETGQAREQAQAGWPRPVTGREPTLRVVVGNEVIEPAE